MASKKEPKRLYLYAVECAVTEEQLAGLMTLSAATLATVNALVRAAIDDYLQKVSASEPVVRSGLTFLSDTRGEHDDRPAN